MSDKSKAFFALTCIENNHYYELRFGFLKEIKMDWPTIINEILWMEKITQKQLSASLVAFVTPSAINRLKKGYTRMPNYSLGNELIKRHKRLKLANANA